MQSHGMRHGKNAERSDQATWGVEDGPWTYLCPPSDPPLTHVPSIKDSPWDFVVMERSRCGWVARSCEEAPPLEAFPAAVKATGGGEEQKEREEEREQRRGAKRARDGSTGGERDQASPTLWDLAKLQLALASLESGDGSIPVSLALPNGATREERAKIHRLIGCNFCFVNSRTVGSAIECTSDESLRPCMEFVDISELLQVKVLLHDLRFESPGHVTLHIRRGGRDALEKVHRVLVESFLALEARCVGDDVVTVTRIYRRHSSGIRKRKVQECGAVPEEAAFKTYTGFVLRKEGWEHHAARDTLSACLGCPPTALSFAGIKDKWAVTYQLCVGQGLASASVERVRRKLPQGLSISPCVEGLRGPLNSGDHAGNRFQIRLRWSQTTSLPSCNVKSIAARCQSLAEHGFVNFFGDQRFGGSSPSSAAAARSEKEEEGDNRGVGDIVSPSLLVQCLNTIRRVFTRKPCSAAKAAEEKEKNRSEQATARVPCWMVGRELIRGNHRAAVIMLLFGGNLELYEDDAAVEQSLRKPLGAEVLQEARRVHKELLRLGQPWQWERAIAKVSYSRRSIWANSYQSHLWNRMACQRLEKYPARPVPGDLVLIDDGGEGGSAIRKKTIKELKTEEEAESFTIFSVCLPLPGCRTTLYPSHAVGLAYFKEMQNDGTLGALTSSGGTSEAGGRRKSRGFKLKGGYRCLACIPQAVSCSAESAQSDYGVTSVGFDLPPGSFATVALRELLRP